MQITIKNKNQSIRSKGFTLVELMIAMTLGFFLIAGVGTVYLGSKKTYKLQGQTAELDENARHALRALKHHIAHAGYASTSGVILDNYIIPDGASISTATCADGNPNIAPGATIETSGDGSVASSAAIAQILAEGDTLGLRFMADDNLATDCLGGALIAACLPPVAPSLESRLIYNSFSIARSSIDNNRDDFVPMLRCRGSRNVNGQDMARGVENIQFLYGVDQAADGSSDGSVDSYWNATAVSAANAWDKIISVRVGLLIRSVEPVFDDNRAETYQVLDQSIAKNDRYQRGVYSTTIRLKNVARRM